MNRLISLIFLIFISFALSGQDTIIRYYQGIELKKETNKEKARYKTISTSIGENFQIDLYKIGSGKLIWRKSFRDNKPYGEWYDTKDNNSTSNYRVYGRYEPQGHYVYDAEKERLKESIPGIFTKPRLTGVDETIFKEAEIRKLSDLVIWIAINIKYPVEAQIAGIQGIVKAQFTLDEAGRIGNVRIIEGVHEILDIESYRLLKSIPGMQPAKLDGKPVKLFVEVPISFILR